ncbi:hypothetical protein [uncultured Novosphingobium sp.]|uniref:hypothetical protein n=1 Tax=uncultured Novosphingobium sp. TaxID=292277 RepID=UPI00258A0E41|nr:hypothetical protein [uncultured Novosphingobium sp.]
MSDDQDALFDWTGGKQKAIADQFDDEAKNLMREFVKIGMSMTQLSTASDEIDKNVLAERVGNPYPAVWIGEIDGSVEEALEQLLGKQVDGDRYFLLRDAYKPNHLLKTSNREIQSDTLQNVMVLRLEQIERVKAKLSGTGKQTIMDDSTGAQFLSAKIAAIGRKLGLQDAGLGMYLNALSAVVVYYAEQTQK